MRCGDDPCAGSNNAVAPWPNTRSGLIVADPHNAGEPARAQTTSERMSPKIPSVTITDGRSARATSSYAARSTFTSANAIPEACEVSRAIRRHSREVANTLALSTLIARRPGCCRAHPAAISNTSRTRDGSSTSRSSAGPVPSLSV